MSIAPARPVRALLLQGPRSPFFAQLADALEAQGAQVERVLFCPGDHLFWRRAALRFRGAREDWPGFLREIIAARGVTDVVGLGDGRWQHAEGYPVARGLGARVHVVEQGWLRPGFVTVEPDALGAWRPAPDAPDAPPPPAPRFRASFAAFAAMDVAHHLANALAAPLGYRRHRSHEVTPAAAEWLGWAGKAARWPLRRRAAAAALRRIADHRGPVFLMALQLETDFQIRTAGPPGGVRGALARAIAAFAAAAPPDALLVVKPHPLDPQIIPWARLAAAPRVVFLDGGDIAALTPRLAGVVTVNSTVGLSALRAGLPVAVMGRAIYEDLAWRGGPEAFFAAPPSPDRTAVARFVARMAAEIQTPGAFDGEGMRHGAEGAAALILRRARA